MQLACGTLIIRINSQTDLINFGNINDLKVAEQCQEAYRKANRMLGLVKRIIVCPDPVVLVRLQSTDHTWSTARQHGVRTIRRTRLFWKKCSTVSPDCSQS